MALDLKDEIFVIYIVFIGSLNLIYLFYRAEIVLLKADKVSTTVLPKYADFVDIFSPIQTIEL